MSNVGESLTEMVPLNGKQVHLPGMQTDGKEKRRSKEEERETESRSAMEDMETMIIALI